MAHEQMAQRERTMKTLEDIFEALDENKSGTIEMDEFMHWTNNGKAQAFFELVLGIDIFRAAHTFRLLDSDHSGTITREE